VGGGGVLSGALKGVLIAGASVAIVVAGARFIIRSASRKDDDKPYCHCGSFQQRSSKRNRDR
jgi:hypothetical protein